MSKCIPEASISKSSSPGISTDAIQHVMLPSCSVQWREACDVRPDACPGFQSLLPQGYLIVRCSGGESMYYLQGGILYASSVDPYSLEILGLLNKALDGKVVVRECGREDNASRLSIFYPAVIAGISLVVLGIVIWVWRKGASRRRAISRT